MPDMPTVGSPGAQRCWQIMTGLRIASRVEAIEFLRATDYLPHLSIREIRSLVEMFPLMPDDLSDGDGTRTLPFGGAR